MMAKIEAATTCHQVVLNHRPALSHHQVVPKLQPVQVSLQVILTQEELRILPHQAEQ